MDDLSKRVFLVLAAGGAATALKGCSPQQVQDTETRITNIINQIQKGVADACAAFGKWVPQANSVLQLLLQIVGASKVVLATETMIATAITDIVGQACPAPGPPKADVRGVPIKFY